MRPPSGEKYEIREAVSADVPWNAPWYRRLGFETLADADAPDFLKDLLALERFEGLSPPARVAMIHWPEVR